MSKYETIFEALQKKLNDNCITMEEANILNDIAYAVEIDEGESFTKEDAEKFIDEMLTTEGAYKRHVENMNKNYDAQKKSLETMKKQAETATGKVKQQLDESIKRKEEEMKRETEKLHEKGIVNSDEYAERQKHAKELGEGMRKSREIEKKVGDVAKGNSPKAIAKRAFAGAKEYNSKEYKDAQKKINDNAPEYLAQKADKKKFHEESQLSPNASSYKDSGVAPKLPKRKLFDKITLNKRMEKIQPGYKKHKEEIAKKLAECKLTQESVNELKLNVIQMSLAGDISVEEKVECLQLLDSYTVE